MAKPNVATGGGGGVDETKSAPTIDQPTPPPADQAPTPPDPIPTGAAILQEGSLAQTGRETTIEIQDGAPNSPCFDYNPETGKPNLRGDEEILVEKMKNNVRVVVTTSGRKIFCCSLPTFCDVFGPPPMPVDYYLKFFPWAK